MVRWRVWQEGGGCGKREGVARGGGCGKREGVARGSVW